jgi:methionyl aminopeptidase
MSNIHLKTPDEVAAMRETGRIVARALQAMREAVRPGISTGELDKIAETVIRDHGATPAFLNYPKHNAPPYPASINASINDELVHGIPSFKRLVKEGDIISLDTACHYGGFVADAAFTIGVGEIKPALRRLIDVTEKALYIGIEASVLGNTIKDVALSIYHYVERQGYSVARDYTGHGVGRAMHEEPSVPNWWPRPTRRRRQFDNYQLQVGMTYAIEPMVITGRSETEELEDYWTVRTVDRSMCAHFEHTIAVTDGKPIILTLP